MIEREGEGQRHRRREKQAPFRDPNVGLEPGTPGSRPGPKAGVKPLSHPRIPMKNVFKGQEEKREFGHDIKDFHIVHFYNRMQVVVVIF